MGCICSKGKSSDDYLIENHVNDKESKANRSSKQLGTTLRREKVAIDVDGAGNDATARLIPNMSRNGNSGSTPISSDEGEKNGEITSKPVKVQAQTSSNMGIRSVGQGQPRVSRIVSVSRGERGAQVLAGWPSWLTAVAGEAISGWIPRRADSFEKLDKVIGVI